VASLLTDGKSCRRKKKGEELGAVEQKLNIATLLITTQVSYRLNIYNPVCN
jgi:hypothetical protein